jgi:hypothetical protein
LNERFNHIFLPFCKLLAPST